MPSNLLPLGPFHRSGNLKLLFSKWKFVAGLSILLFYIFIGLVVAPKEYPGDLLTMMTMSTAVVYHCTLPLPPTLTLYPFSLGSHPFGETAFMGYGVAQGLVVGTRWDLYLIGTILLLSALIGIITGTVAGTFGGRTDWILMTVTDTVLSVPDFIFIVIVVTSLTSPVSPLYGPTVFMGASILAMWAPYARGVRSQALRVSALSYVESARAAGASRLRIAWHHIMPNSLTPALAQIPITVAVILALVIGIQFVGAVSAASLNLSCGVPPPTYAAPIVPNSSYPEWGGILAAGLAFSGAYIPQPGEPLGSAWWGYVIPAIWIGVFGLGVLYLTDGLKDWLSPRNR